MEAEPVKPPAEQPEHEPKEFEPKEREPKEFEQRAKKRRPRRLLWWLLALACACGLFVFVAYRTSLRRSLGRLDGTPAPFAETMRVVDNYASAVAKIEEERGEAVGRKAREIEIPAELKHYADRRRFLAVQVAAAGEAQLDIPHDFAALAALVEREGEFVELPRLGEGYLLYGVGLGATGNLTHYDPATGRTVPLFAGEEQLAEEEARIRAALDETDTVGKDLARQLDAPGKSDAHARAGLLAARAFNDALAQSLSAERKLLAFFYKTARSRQLLFSEYETLRRLAANFGGRSYNLDNPQEVKQLKVRLLSFVRPASRRLIEELGRAYREKFDRRLPLTSLMRPEEYQQRLRQAGNPNAAAFELPPHATGLAFDIFYRYMTKEEQEFVMAELARLEREGRAESLRELRDHYHVFAFAEGRPPTEQKIERTRKRLAGGGARQSE